MSTKMFDFSIGNPPFQKYLNDTSDKPIYNEFMDASYKIADKVELIHPARFLFDAGKTPKEWNEKILNDEHFKVLKYEQNSSKVFANTDIKGGVAITYRDYSKEYGAIKIFTPFNELKEINRKVQEKENFISINTIMFLQTKLNLQSVYSDQPELKKYIGSKGKERRLTTSVFSTPLLHDHKIKKDDIKVLGLIKNKRNYRFIKKEYIDNSIGNLNFYKVIVPKSNGTGAIGEVLSTPLIGTPLIGYTQSFLGIGSFDNEDEANSCLKYIKTKFSRTMLGILKITQDNPPEKWKLVPLQDFTDHSDIDWSKSIPEIDQQLYRKYGLSDEEIDFIETHVKEMK